MSIIGHFVDFEFEPYLEMVEDFTLRITRNSSLTYEKMSNCSFGHLAFPRKFTLNPDKELPYPALKRYNPYLAQKERRYISFVLSLEDIPWNVITNSCTYNNEETLAVLRRYYEAPAFIRNAVVLLNSNIESPRIADYLKIAPYQAFQFRFLDYPDSVRRQLELVMQGFLNRFYSRLEELCCRNILSKEIMDDFCAVRDKSLADLITEWRENMGSERVKSYIGETFKNECNDRDRKYHDMGLNLSDIEIALRLYRHGLTLEEIKLGLNMPVDLIALAMLFERLSNGVGSTETTLYDGKIGWQTI